jgi:hypothetical protein
VLGSIRAGGDGCDGGLGPVGALLGGSAGLIGLTSLGLGVGQLTAEDLDLVSKVRGMPV